jgi:hypothetical protein
VDAVLARLAACQHGLVNMAQLAEAGLANRNAVRHRVANGRLHRVHRGVYAVGHGRLSQEGRWMAAVLWAGEGAVLSHLSAAKLWNAWRRRVAGIDVIAPRRRHRPTSGVRVRRCRRLDRRDVTVRNGIPTTTMARTLVDLTDVLDKHQLANVIHEAAFLNHFSAPATHTAIQRANGRHRLDILQAALEAHATGSAGTRSGPEDRFLALVRSAGLPEPLVNTPVNAGGRQIEVDFHWPDRALIVEIDGGGHARPRTRLEDEARDRTLQTAGSRVLRFTDDELDEQPAAVLARL